MEQLNKTELVLVESQSFFDLTNSYSRDMPDNHDCFLFYEKLKAIEQRIMGDKFVLGVFINKVRVWCREGAIE